MYSIRQDRKDRALLGAAMAAMAGFFLACLLLPWMALAYSPWLAIPLALGGTLAWLQWGLWATGGPVAVFSRGVMCGVNGLVLLVAALRILGWT